MSKKKALFWYGAIFDDINAYNIATAKEFKIKDIVSFIEDSRNEINLRESKYINYLNKQKLKFISDNYKFNLIDVPYLSQIEENNGIYRYKNNAKNFYYSLYRKESFLRKIKIQENINQLALLAYNVEISLMNFLKFKEYSEVYIFNNRFPIGNAASRACSNLGIPFITYDLVADKRMHYSKNASVLSAENFKIAVDNELNYLSTLL